MVLLQTVPLRQSRPFGTTGANVLPVFFPGHIGYHPSHWHYTISKNGRTFLWRGNSRDPAIVGQCMLTLHRHRATILAVSSALLLSSVGLPVIVVACEMGSMVTSRACGGSSRRVPLSGVQFTSMPCHAQYRFIEGNSTAYVPAKPAVGQHHLQILAVVPLNSSVVGLCAPFFLSPSESPPRTRDIPVLLSSFLI